MTMTKTAKEKHRSDQSPPWDSPVLITGCPRSGTSALAQLLSTHPKFCIFNEFSLYSDPVLEESVWHRIRQMGDNPPPTKVCRDMASLKVKLATDLPTPVDDVTFRNWIFGLLDDPVSIYGDKMPYKYLEDMDQLVKRHPKVRFLLTLRDGRAVVASQIRRYRHAIEKRNQTGTLDVPHGQGSRVALAPLRQDVARDAL